MKLNIITCSIMALLVSLTSCTTDQQIEIGQYDLVTPGGRIWYEITGAGNGVPLIVLHGGPGYPSYSLNAIKELGAERPIVMYDQLGCGRSDRITDQKLMTIEYYVKELSQLITSLNLNEVHLYGHSWGAMLAIEYYLNNTGKVKSMILSSPCLDLTRWIEDAEVLISGLPEEARNFIYEDVRNENSDSVRMKEAINLFYNTYYTRKQPISDDMQKTINEAGLNVYNYMWGKEDYVVTGSLKGYDITDELGEVLVPVLYLTGEFDSARPTTVEHYKSITPKSQIHIISGAGHQTLQDNPEEAIIIMKEFLKD